MAPAPSVTVLVPLSSPLPQPHSDETVGNPALEIHQLFHTFWFVPTILGPEAFAQSIKGAQSVK